MKKLEEKHWQAILKNLDYDDNGDAVIDSSATSCAEITKDLMLRFNEWTHVNKWNRLEDMGKVWWSKTHGLQSEMGLTEEELFNLFIETI